MITHVVSFRWKPDTTSEQVSAVSTALATLPALVPSISTYRFGSDLGTNGSANMDFAIVATFASLADWRLYNEDPDHDRIRREIIGPMVAERASVQFTS